MKSIRMTQKVRMEEKRSRLRCEGFELSLKQLKDQCFERMKKERTNWLKANRELSRDVVKRRVEIERKNREIVRLREMRTCEREEMNMKLISLRDEADRITRTMLNEMRSMRQEIERETQENERRKKEIERRINEMKREFERENDRNTATIRKELENQRRENDRLREILKEQECTHDEVLRHEVERKLNAMDTVEAMRRELEQANIRAERERSKREREERERKRLKGVCEWYDVMLRRATSVCAKMSRNSVVVSSSSGDGALVDELPSPVKDAVVVVSERKKQEEEEEDDDEAKLRQELEKMAMSAYEGVLDALVYVPVEE